MSSSNSPCAACKFLRRKCTQECVFAPYFPPDNPQRFAYVHKVFGASNVAKLLNELSAAQRDDAVKSLAYEAEARLRDPVYGCVGLISVLQHRLKQIQGELTNAKKELATYIGPQALQGIPPAAVFQHLHAAAANPFGPSVFASMPSTHGGQMVMRDPQPSPQQMFGDPQLAAAVAAREQRDMLRGFEHQQQQLQQQQHQQEFLRFNSGGFDLGTVPDDGFCQHVSPSAPVSQNLIGLSPSLALGSFENHFHHMQQQHQGEPHANNAHVHSHHIPLEAQLLLTPRQEKQAQQQTQQPQLSHHHQQQHLDRKERGLPC
ncbi:hypothetical protein TanjilG_01023 [Lupinus angustifolius]|uniref:LOB domain-containing protein n=1 Tax=Lupinus angustifolius TaxID=3871 RepID=A0A4P1QR45_LUPAN|nr:PREDICTED: LOB domain-containing protein 36-like [Lupinus angustifolius]XP_019422683.1 PREDICTED: LOB domain-containing protein 36-like [Lupinus angustifolius]XP_019422684.1 PREDICTED: LOB domain-containing protein 36-like [Lupinus angustifolius]OIV92889.1 hypothetical protein TanjilG_01023 [Lupinus angustifolius]